MPNVAGMQQQLTKDQCWQAFWAIAAEAEAHRAIAIAAHSQPGTKRTPLSSETTAPRTTFDNEAR